MAYFVLFPLDDCRVRNRYAQRVTEQGGNGEPVRQSTDHACLGECADVADPRAGVALVFQPAHADVHEEGHHQHQSGDSLVLSQIGAALRFGLRIGAGHGREVRRGLRSVCASGGDTAGRFLVIHSAIMSLPRDNPTSPKKENILTIIRISIHSPHAHTPNPRPRLACRAIVRSGSQRHRGYLLGSHQRHHSPSSGRTWPSPPSGPLRHCTRAHHALAHGQLRRFHRLAVAHSSSDPGRYRRCGPSHHRHGVAGGGEKLAGRPIYSWHSFRRQLRRSGSNRVGHRRAVRRLRASGLGISRCARSHRVCFWRGDVHRPSILPARPADRRDHRLRPVRRHQFPHLRLRFRRGQPLGHVLAPRLTRPRDLRWHLVGHPHRHLGGCCALHPHGSAPRRPLFRRRHLPGSRH